MIRIFIIGLLCALASAENTGNCKVDYLNMSKSINVHCNDIKIDSQDNPLDLIRAPTTNAYITLSLTNCTGKISENSFKNLREMNELSLVETKLDGFVLPKLPKLFQLYMEKSTVPTLNGAFKNAEVLRSVGLSNNNFKLDDNSFKGFSTVTILEIWEQDVVLSELLFKDLKSLSILRLTNTNIDKIPRNVFQENTELITLYIGKNPTKTIEQGALDPLKKLGFLHVGRTDLEIFNLDLVKELKELASLGIPARTLKNLDLKKLLEYCPNISGFYFLPKDSKCAGVKELQDEISKLDASISLTFTGDDVFEKSC